MDLHRIARKTAGTGGRCSVSGEKTMLIQRLPSSRGHTRPPRLSFALVVVLNMNARRFQRTHCLSGSGSSLNASKDIGMEISDIMPISEPVIDAGYASVVGSPCLCVFEVIARTDLPTYATLATHNGHSF